MGHDHGRQRQITKAWRRQFRMNDPLIGVLADNSVFGGLTEQQLQDVRAAGNVRRFESGSLVIRQGDPALAFYVILCGYARVAQVTPDGHQVLIRFVEPGNGFGLTSALSGFENLWSVQAIGECRALVWHGELLAQLMERYARISFNALRVMVLRNQELQHRYQELLTEPVEQRVAQALLRLSRDVGLQTKDGILIGVPLSRRTWPNTAARPCTASAGSCTSGSWQAGSAPVASVSWCAVPKHCASLSPRRADPPHRTRLQMLCSAQVRIYATARLL